MTLSMTKAELLAALRALAKSDDTEGAHGRADDLLCEVLRHLGYGEGVAIFEKMDKWYA